MPQAYLEQLETRPEHSPLQKGAVPRHVSALTMDVIETMIAAIVMTFNKICLIQNFVFVMLVSFHCCLLGEVPNELKDWFYNILHQQGNYCKQR